MLTFYKRKSDSFTDRVEEKLDEMVVAHNILTVDGPSDLPDRLSPQQLPALSNNHDLWTSRQAILAHLDDLHQDLKLSRSLQSDTCHLDPENPDQCL